jgi:glycosyltransferase involved in cell wall biosynthesis
MSGILILDTSYTLKMIKERNLYKALHARKLGGFFTKVISAHPYAGLFESGSLRLGRPIISKIDNDHIFISGKMGINKFFNLFPPINFIFSQIILIKILISLSIKNKVKIIRIGDPLYLGLLGVLLSKILKVPLAIRIGADFDEFVKQTKMPMLKRLFYFRFIEKIIERFVLARCHLVAGANQNNANYAKKNGAKKELVTVFRYGNLLHSNHWKDPRKRKLLKFKLGLFDIKKTNFVTTISRLEKEKGVDSVIKTASELKKRKKYKVKFLIIGDGTQRGYLESLAIKLNVSKDVIFLGNKDQVWISSILPFSLAVLSPHGGRALAESCLAGVPIVAYDFEWQNEMILNNQTGFLIRNKKWKGFVDKIIYILENKRISKTLGVNARVHALKMMNPKKLDEHEKSKYIETLKNYKITKGN